MKKNTQPLFSGSEWDVPLLDKMWKVIDKIGRETFGLDYYEPQLEVITAEQMLDNYSSAAMPVMYPHWSFGKTFLQNEREYNKGIQGLAYEVVINTNPCIAYLMENNTATLMALVLAHASCVDADTECLTEKGWIKISEYAGQPIAQYDENGSVIFKKPVRYIETQTDSFYEIKARGVSQKVTPDHTMVYKSHLGKLKKESANNFVERHLSKTRGHCGKFITHFNYEGKGVPYTEEEIKLAVAIKADGSLLPKQNSGHFNCVDYQRVRFHLKKERKITRLCEILNKLDIEYIKTGSYEGRVSILFNVPLNKYTKRYEEFWYQANAGQLAIIGEEVLHWDGDQKGNFSSISKSCADYVQFVWATQGYGTYIYKDRSKETVCFKVQRGSYSERSISRSRGGVPNEIVQSAGGKAYCFTTDTGMWLARREDNIFVTGNCGHSHFFKNNYLFKGWTDAGTIVDYLKFARNYIKSCEEKYGAVEVEILLDACHSLQSHGIDKYRKPNKPNAQQMGERARSWEKYAETEFNDLWRTVPKQIEMKRWEKQTAEGTPEENILYFLEKHSPILKPWEREIVRIVRKISQYFYPQRQTQLLNEGFACYTHHMIMTEMYNQGHITAGSYLEFLQSHTNVVSQQDWDSKYYHGINVYALGYAMLMDIHRICEQPDDEDKKWFPDIAGNGQGLETVKHIVANYRDESFVVQFLSPRVARQFKLFSLHVAEGSGYLEVNATHDDEDFLQVRKTLSEQYDLSRSVPQVEVVDVDWQGDRWLMLEHKTKNNQRLHYGDMKKTAMYIQYLWGFSVKMEYVDLDGNPLEDV